MYKSSLNLNDVCTLLKYTYRLSQCHYLTGILSLNKQILISLIIKVLTIFKKIMSLKVTNLHSVSNLVFILFLSGIPSPENLRGRQWQDICHESFEEGEGA